MALALVLAFGANSSISIAQRPIGPAEVIDAYAAAINAGDLEAALALVADDAVYDRPTGAFVGKAEVRGFVEGILARNALVELLGERSVDGEMATWRSRVTIDDPANPDGPPRIIHNLSASRVVDGLIVMHTAEPAPDILTTWPTMLHVGTLPGTDAFVAIASDGSRVLAYVCDGTAESASLWGWFEGDLIGGRADLVSANGLVLRLTTTRQGSTGTVVLRDGREITFTAESANGNASLWRWQGTIEGAAILAGRITLDDGRQRGGMVKDGLFTTAEGIVDPDPLDVIDEKEVIGYRIAGISVTN